MKALFSEAGRARLDTFARRGLLCAFDFDGTLAPIVPRPEQARLPAGIRQKLSTLSKYARVAIITGRSIADIRQRLGFTPDFVVGNHGLEGLPGWETHAARHRALCEEWRAQLLPYLRELDDPGIVVEDKEYSLSVHYRAAHGGEAIATRLAGLFGRLRPPPRVMAGKQLFNLVPQDAANKGDALRRLMKMAGASRALYAGDDVTDEDAFRLPRNEVLSVRIEHAPHSAAEFFLPHVQDVALLLDDLVRRLRDSTWNDTAGLVARTESRRSRGFGVS